MQISAYTRTVAEDYRTAKAAYLDPSEWTGTSEQLAAAKEAFLTAARVLAGSVLDDIDRAEGAS